MSPFKKNPRSPYYLAFADLKEGLKNWHIWQLLSWQDIKLRYRRSTLGPFWITLSMAITIYTMGLLYGRLFKMDLTEYYPFLATGMLTWSLLSVVITDSTNIFIESENFLKQMKQPYFTFVFRAAARNFTIFFHNILVLLPIIIFFHLKITPYTLLVFVALLIIWLNAVAYGMILAILGTRFRDLPQMVNSLVQIIFFLTPIMWSPATLPERYRYIVELNPFAQFVELLRAPLMGAPLPAYTIAIVLAITLAGLIVAFFLFAKYRSRIVYWL
jgi:ABC-type polysaccharide/polyol phosphate export permease